MRERKTRPINWNNVPEHLRWLSVSAEKFNAPEICVIQSEAKFIRSLSETDLDELRNVYERLLASGQLQELREWINSSPRVKHSTQALRTHWMLFEVLAKAGIQPFADTPPPCEPAPEPVWERVPAELQFLLPFAQRYPVDSESEILHIISNLNEAEERELSQVADQARAAGSYRRLFEHMESHSMVDCMESHRLYMLFGLLDHLDLKFE